MNSYDGSLLLYCLGVRPNDGRIVERPWLNEADTAELLRQAGDNGLTPLLYHRLRHAASGPRLPAATMAELRDHAFRWAAQSLRAARELGQILEQFHRHGVAVIVLKGAYLGPLVYGSSSLRAMGDIDLMVPRDRLPVAEELLGQVGYVPLHDPLDRTDYMQHHHTRPLGKPGALRVDLHWNIERPTTPFDVDLPGIWRRAVPARLAGVDALVLSPEDVILHLCLHTSFDHQFRLGLRGCWDLLEVIRHHGASLDWAELARRAGAWGIGRYVYLTLCLVRELLGAEVPMAAIASLEPTDFSPRVLAWARTSIFAPDEHRSVSPSVARLWRSRPVRAKLAILLETLFPPRWAVARTYRVPPESGRLFLYYPVRWLRLLHRYSRPVWSLWRGDGHTHDELQAVSERVALGEWLTGSSRSTLRVI